MPPLKNQKRELFCQAYVGTNGKPENAFQAYLSAGYKSSEEAARRSASELLTNPDVKQRIQELRDQQQKRFSISSDMILDRLASIAFSNLTDAVEFDENGVRIKSSKTLSEKTKASLVEVSSVRKESGDSVVVANKVKQHDQLKALELLMKHLGMLSDFNQAVNTLNSYGISLKRNENGNWQVENQNNEE